MIMSKLDELIKELCPDGVEYVSIGSLICKVTEKGKNDISVTQVYVVSNTLGLVKAEEYRENTIHSEDTSNYTIVRPNTIAYNPARLNIGSIALNKSNIAGLVSPMYIVFNVDASKILPEYLELLIKSEYVLGKIDSFKEEGARFRFDFKRWDWIKIPLPPIKTQIKVIAVLGKFSNYISLLQSELTKRRRQYEYYRDALLTFDKPNGGGYNSRVKLGEIAVIMRGGNFQKKDFVESGLPCIHYGQMYTHFGTWADKTLTFVSKDVFEKSRQAHPSDIIMAVTSENVEDVCKCTAWVGSEPVAVSGHTAIIRHNQNAKYLSYFFQSAEFYRQKVKLAHGTKVIEVTPDKLNGIEIPLPPLDVQERLVRVLDNFDSICSDLKIGLPAEIEARKKQYEYYRDALLTFAESGRIAADNVGGGVSV